MLWEIFELWKSPTDDYLTQLVTRTSLTPLKHFHTDTFTPSHHTTSPLGQQARQNNSFCHTIASSRSRLTPGSLGPLYSPGSFALSVLPPRSLAFFFLLDHRNSTKTRAGSCEWRRPFLLCRVFVMSELCGVGWCLCSPALWWLWGTWEKREVLARRCAFKASLWSFARR